jgi:hypothetical protein
MERSITIVDPTTRFDVKVPFLLCDHLIQRFGIIAPAKSGI